MLTHKPEKHRLITLCQINYRVWDATKCSCHKSPFLWYTSFIWVKLWVFRFTCLLHETSKQKSDLFSFHEIDRTHADKTDSITSWGKKAQKLQISDGKAQCAKKWITHCVSLCVSVNFAANVPRWPACGSWQHEPSLKWLRKHQK